MKNNYNYLSKFLLTSFAFVVMLFTTGCETTEPPERKPESVREYTWQIDTLDIPDAFQNTMESIWASGSNNIYICGHNSGSQIYQGNGNMWHYDGNVWRVVDIRNSAGWNGKLNFVHGSSADNIWAVGYNGRYDIELQRDILYPFILQLESGKAKRHIVDTKHAVYGVFVESETSVWACGDGGLVYHYDGNDWDVDTIKIDLENDEVFQLEQIVKYNDAVYVTGIKHGLNEGWGTLFLYKQENGWKEIAKSDWGTGNYSFDVGLYVSENDKFYSHGMGGVFFWENEQWQNIFSIESSINSISVESENNILAVGSFGKVFHYNGTDWKLLDNLENTDVIYRGALLYKEEAFIIGYDLSKYPMKTFVLNGK